MSQQPPTKRELRKQRQIDKQKRREHAQKKHKQKRMMIWGVALALIVAVIVAVSQSGSNDPNDVTTHPTFIQEGDQIKGGADALTTLIEYSDFECPACAGFYPVIKDINEEFGDRLKIVYRHYPLVQIHPQAELAARASEAAGKQDKFWEMHDLLFETQREWSGPRSAEDYFVGLAEDLELDIEQFKADLASKEVRDKVSDDRRSGNRLNVSSTPTFYLNGKKVGSLRNFSDLRDQVALAISETPNVVPINDADENETATSSDEMNTGDGNGDTAMQDDVPVGEICEDLCGDGQCQEIVCQGQGCPCSESAESCAQDCSI